MSLFVLEDLETAETRKIASFMGVDYEATPLAWLNFPLMAGLGIVLAFIFAPSNSWVVQIGVGLVYGILIILTGLVHSIGHVFMSRWVNAPMSREMMTATVNLTLYEDDPSLPSWKHIARSLGGPLENLIMAGIFYLISTFIVQHHFITFFMVANLVLALLTLLPIPTTDGSVVVRELRNWKS